MKQYTIEGKIENIDFSRLVTKSTKRTIKEKFRAIYGINKNVKCKECIYIQRINVNDKHYYKCKIMGISGSSATDIRLKDYGCSKWEKKDV